MTLVKAKSHLENDKILKGVIESTDILKLPKSGHVFNELVKAIVYQQISYKAADAIYNRFLDLVRSPLYMPEDILIQEEELLRGVGLSRQKTQYMGNIARFFKEHDLMLVDWSSYSDREIIELLTQIKGVGEWTVQMILIFELGRPDILPAKDLGIQLAMKDLYDLKTEKTALVKEILSIGEDWSPYRTFASLYLWSWRRDNY